MMAQVVIRAGEPVEVVERVANDRQDIGSGARRRTGYQFTLLEFE
ncbi:MAG TPA: hypothetical protein VIW27_10170 [Gammaproteobacteria bacterium]|jgi:hypothetical protein